MIIVLLKILGLQQLHQKVLSFVKLLRHLICFLMDQVEHFFHSRSKRMAVSVAFLFLTIAISLMTFICSGVTIMVSL